MARWPSPQPCLKFRCNKICSVFRTDQVQRIFSLLPAPKLRSSEAPSSRLPTPDSRLPTPDSRLPAPKLPLPTPCSPLPAP
ncbi:MAG: hypothetical protein F6K56_29700 [Moorea sp. SIO3G5]|nr:hypothetical protein [Moorena sp. SIO3G5]